MLETIASHTAQEITKNLQAKNHYLYKIIDILTSSCKVDSMHLFVDDKLFIDRNLLNRPLLLSYDCN